MRFLYISKQDLIKLIRQSHQFVVINLHDKWNSVSVFSRDAAEHPESRGNAVATALHRQLHNVFRVKILRIRSKRGSGGMLDALIDRQNRNVTRARQSSVID